MTDGYSALRAKRSNPYCNKPKSWIASSLALLAMTAIGTAGGCSMSLKLFELVGTDEQRPFSPFCWRTRMALAHKGLSAESIPWCFTEKDAIAPHNSEKVPVLIDDETSVADSWAIANYLEDTYSDRPSLF